MPKDAPQVFSGEWGRRVAAAINASDGYRREAARWSDSLALVMEDAPDGHPRAAVLELRHGGCDAVRTNDEARPDEAAFTLGTTSAEWQEVLAGRLDPLWGIMSGRLRLTRGGLAALLPFATAAKRLVEAIAAVETTFPSTASDEEESR